VPALALFALWGMQTNACYILLFRDVAAIQQQRPSAAVRQLLPSTAVQLQLQTYFGSEPKGFQRIMANVRGLFAADWHP
jgi:hypothetical protein